MTSDKQQNPYFDNPLQYNAYLATPDSRQIFPELNKDLSISNINSRMQRVILIKGRVANYISMVFEALKNEETGAKVTMGSQISFMRDIMAIGVTSQGLNAMLLKQLTESSQHVKHSYNMDKEYKKNIGGN
jgi:hypothetical protein